ncbi:hypothetical protein ACFVT6_24120 [Streptomyces sp. NPDC058049]|uniref:hypothetical protein n=1 Tax=Streptomyces sp. NPDC058049 TaxID=3346314 RepID=UPI0036E86E0A
MATHLRFLALTVTTATAETTYRFDQPATVISGPSGAGKSSLLMLLKHAVGGTAVLTPAVRDHVHSVLASVVVGEQHMILKRTISGDRSDRVDILDPETMALQHTFRTRAEEGQRSLSDVLLDALGFPREKIPTTRLGKATTLNLTFTHLFRYVYLEARDLDRQVVGHLDNQFKKQRKALFELMFGLTTSAVMELERQVNQLTTDLRKAEAEEENVGSFLRATDPRTDDELRTELAGLRDMLHNAETTLRALRTDVSESSAADAVLRGDLRAAVQTATAATQEVLAARELVEARESVVAQVELDLQRLERSATAIDQLAPFHFVVCPRCAQRLDARTVPEGHCGVCLQADPAEEDTDPAAVQKARNALEQQLQDARELMEADTEVLRRARERSSEAEFLATNLRRQLDAQTRDVVAPRFDAISDASARVAALNAGIDAVLHLRDSWTRVRAIAQGAKDITARRKAANAELKTRRAENDARRSLVTELSRLFSATLMELNLPWEQSALVDPATYLPVVDNTPFESLQASGGALQAGVNIAYHLALLECGLTHPDILVPSILLIDSPRRALGSNRDDQERGRRIYGRFKALTDAYGPRLQLIIADNDTAPLPDDAFSTIELDYTHPMVPGVAHPGPEHTTRTEHGYEA